MDTRRLLVPCLALTALVACGPAGDGDGDGDRDYPFPELQENGIDEYLGTVEPSSMDEANGVRQYEFDAADGPICLRGGAFTMATRPSDSSGNLLVYLQGGGACWSDLCQANEEAEPGVPEAGVLNRDLEANPFADWDVGYVPYCDGALFTGDTEIDDDDDGVIDRYHRGRLNLSAALDVIQGDFPEPERVVLVGASAGSYGTIFGATLLRAVYPNADIDVVADAGLGFGKPDNREFIDGVLGEWEILDLLDGTCNDCTSNGHLTEFITWVLDNDEHMRFAAITALRDVVIGEVFLGLTGAMYEDIVLEQTSALEDLHGEQYRRYLFPGVDHTVVARDTTVPQMGPLPSGTIDGTEVGGVTPGEWLGEWLDSDVESVLP